MSMRTINTVHMVDNRSASPFRTCNIIKTMDLILTLKVLIISHLPVVSDLVLVLRGKNNQTQIFKLDTVNLLLSSHTLNSHIAIIHLSATFHSQSLPVSSHHALSFSQPQHLRSPRSLPLPLKRITPPSLLLPRRTHLHIALPLPPSLQPPDITWPTHEPHLHPNP